MGMASFLQFQDKRAKVVWSSAAQSQPRETAADCSSGRAGGDEPPSASGAASLAGALTALKRFLAQRDDDRSWLPTFGDRLIADPVATADGPSHGQGRASNGGQSEHGTSDPLSRRSVWGFWL